LLRDALALLTHRPCWSIAPRKRFLLSFFHQIDFAIYVVDVLNCGDSALLL
jgi:hypothetical protein